MTRDELLQQLDDPSQIWDMIVIGGGATGLGTAVEAASRGYRTLLLEQSDFAKGTSSRSTKLIHGGVRYLKQGNLALVLEALHERGLLLRNAPHLVHNLSFVVPLYDWWEGPFYGVGLKLYDMLAGRLGLGPSRLLTREETLELLPTMEPEGLRGGVIYHDGQFDDARLAVHLALTLADLGGTPLNYLQVTGLVKSDGLTTGVTARDLETGREYICHARVVINATGVFSDQVRRLDDPAATPVIAPSQGVHLVLDRSFLPGDSAIMIPHTADGRVLFAVPWHGRVVVGTTDTPVDAVSLEPRPLDGGDRLPPYPRGPLPGPAPRPQRRAERLCRPAAPGPSRRRQRRPPPSPANTPSCSAVRGWSPSPAASGPPTAGWERTRSTRRRPSPGWRSALPRPAGLRLHGWQEQEAEISPWDVYGADAADVRELCRENPAWDGAAPPESPLPGRRGGLGRAPGVGAHRRGRPGAAHPGALSRCPGEHGDRPAGG